MMDYRKELSEQIRWIDSLIIKAEKNLETNKVTDKRLVRISSRKKGFQYYLEEQGGKRTYVKAGDLEQIRKKVQHDYDEAMKDTLVKTETG